MTKAMRDEMNIQVMEWWNAHDCHVETWRRLRSCTAWVGYDIETAVIWLRSYNTIVAAIDMDTDTLYDALRAVYGYTSTSSQHIAKFSHDYGRGKWGCSNTLRYT